MSQPDTPQEIRTETGSDPVNGSTQGLDTSHEGGLTPSTDRLRGQTLVTTRINAIFEIVLCSSVPTQLALGALLRFAGMEPLDIEGRLSLPFVLALSIGDTVLLIALMVILTRVHGESVSELWLGRRRPLREIGYGLLLIPVV